MDVLYMIKIGFAVALTCKYIFEEEYISYGAVYVQGLQSYTVTS